MKTRALSIAGFDGSGGAGLQADLKTFSAFGCYGMTVLTALPVQNTTGVKSCYEIPLQAIQEQLDAIFDDITPQAIKIGMLFNTAIIDVVAACLQKRARDIPIVVDPVMVAKSGDPLLLPEAVDALKTKILPLATVITPNLPEADVLTGHHTKTQDDMQATAQALLAFGSKAVLLKGGHLDGFVSSDLLLHPPHAQTWLDSPRIETKNTHGTGCTLSAAIASCLALGMDIEESCDISKQYLYHALDAAKDERIGHGAGPVHHFHHLWPVSLKGFMKAT